MIPWHGGRRTRDEDEEGLARELGVDLVIFDDSPAWWQQAVLPLALEWRSGLAVMCALGALILVLGVAVGVVVAG
ncbi:MAG: hypothetical protein WCK58_14415 [Chloroflexota bacterium]